MAFCRIGVEGFTSHYLPEARAETGADQTTELCHNDEIHDAR